MSFKEITIRRPFIFWPDTTAGPVVVRSVTLLLADTNQPLEDSLRLLRVNVGGEDVIVLEAKE